MVLDSLVEVSTWETPKMEVFCYARAPTFRYFLSLASVCCAAESVALHLSFLVGRLSLCHGNQGEASHYCKVSQAPQTGVPDQVCRSFKGQHD